MDQFYYESGYVDASYFVYIAEAESAISISSTMTATVGVIKSADAVLTVTAEIQATISHIEGADLFAFTEAALAAEANRIRDNNIEVSAVFTAATDISRIVHVSADDMAFSTVLVGDNLRVRFNEAAIDAAFSLAADVTLVPGGEVIEASGSWSSQFDIEAKGTRKQNIIDEDVTAVFTASIDANRLRGVDAAFEVQAIQNAINDRFRDFDSALQVAAEVTANNYRIVQFASTENAAFTPSVSISITKNSFAVLESTASLAAAGDVSKDMAAGLTAQASQSAEALRIQSSAVAITSSTSLTASGNLENERPWQFTDFGSPAYTATNKVLGIGNLYLATTSDFLVSTSNRPEFSFGTDNFIIEFFAKTSANGTILSYGQYNATGQTGWEIRRTTSGSNIGFQFFRDNGNTTTTHSGLSGFTSADNWYIRLVRSGTNLSMVVRRLSSGTWSSEVTIFSSSIVTDPVGGSVGEVGGSEKLRIGGSYTTAAPGFVGYIDELYIAKDATTAQQFISGAPAINTQGKETTTLLLMHLDSSSLDDTTGTLNAQASLSVQAALSAQADNRVKTATADLQVQGFVVAATGRIRPEVAALDSQFALTANVGRLLASDVSLASEFALSASVLDLDLGQAALSSNFTLSSTPNRRRGISSEITSASSLACSVTEYNALDYGNVRALFHFDNSTVDSVDASGVTTISSSFVTSANSNFSQEIIDPYVKVYRPTGEHSTSAIGNDFAFDLRVRPRFPSDGVGIGGGAYANRLVDLAASDAPSYGEESGWHLQFVFLNSVGSSIAFQLIWNNTLYIGDNVPLDTGGFTNGISNNTFHVAVQKYDTTVEVWVNGVLYESSTNTGIANLAPVGTVTIGQAAVSDQGVGRIDEFRLMVGATPYTSTFTPPALPYVPAENGYTFISATSSMTVNALRVKAAASAITSQVTLQAAGNRLRGISQASSAQATLTTSAIKVSTGEVTAQVQASLAANAIKTAQASISLSTTTALQASAIKYRPATASLSSQATLTPSAVKTAQGASSLSVTATMTVTALRIKQIDSAFQAISTELAAVVKTGQGFIHADLVATLTPQAVKTTSTGSALATTTTVTASPISLSQASASLSTQATFTLTPTYLRRNEAILVVEASQATQAVKTAGASTSLTSEFTEVATTTNSKITGYSASIQATASLSTNNQIVRLASASLASESTILATVYSLVQMQANLQVQGFVLTAGRVLHIDEFNQLKIKGETGQQKILQETRGLVIKSETRVNKIKGYRP